MTVMDDEIELKTQKSQPQALRYEIVKLNPTASISHTRAQKEFI